MRKEFPFSSARKRVSPIARGIEFLLSAKKKKRSSSSPGTLWEEKIQ